MVELSGIHPNSLARVILEYSRVVPGKCLLRHFSVIRDNSKYPRLRLHLYYSTAQDIEIAEIEVIWQHEQVIFVYKMSSANK